MTNHHAQSEIATAEATRQIPAWKVCLMVVVILLMHWLIVQSIVAWMGSEQALVRAQSVSSAKMTDDGWRRTAKGWEYLPQEPQHIDARSYSPSTHISLAQTWPAAVAICLLVMIIGLPDTSSPSALCRREHD